MRSAWIFLAAVTLAFAATAAERGAGTPGLGHGAASAYCQGCHVCDQPTATEPCLTPCPRHGDRFAGVHRSDEGPDLVLIDQLAELYRPVRFSHASHASMSAMTGGCVNCHHYAEADRPVPPCRECHPPGSAGADLRVPSLKAAYHRQCIGCHRDWSHNDACQFCHQVATAGAAPAPSDRTDIVGVSHPQIEAEPYYVYRTSYGGAPLVVFHHRDHVQRYGLGCPDCHRGQSCGRCHDELSPRTPLNHLVTCNTCHRAEQCDLCHGTKVQAAFDHAAASGGWRLGRFHEQVACERCHGPSLQFRTPSPSCLTCHRDFQLGTFDHRVTGLTLDETHREIDCADCHPGGDPGGRPVCDGCHDDRSYPRDRPGGSR